MPEWYARQFIVCTNTPLNFFAISHIQVGYVYENLLS